MKLLDSIMHNVNIKEGMIAIQKYVFTLLCNPHCSVKYVSHQLSLPIPIISAIKNELKKEKVVITNNGISLPMGKALLEKNYIWKI